MYSEILLKVSAQVIQVIASVVFCLSSFECNVLNRILRYLKLYLKLNLNKSFKKSLKFFYWIWVSRTQLDSVISISSIIPTTIWKHCATVVLQILYFVLVWCIHTDPLRYTYSLKGHRGSWKHSLPQTILFFLKIFDILSLLEQHQHKLLAQAISSFK